jgi:ribosomal protein L7/L12
MKNHKIGSKVAMTILNYALQSAKDIANSLDSGNKEEIVNDIENLMKKIKEYGAPSAKVEFKGIHMDFSEHKEKFIAP